jgi:hypothetical protein
VEFELDVFFWQWYRNKNGHGGMLQLGAGVFAGLEGVIYPIVHAVAAVAMPGIHSLEPVFIYALNRILGKNFSLRDMSRNILCCLNMMCSLPTLIVPNLCKFSRTIISLPKLFLLDN